MKRMIPALLLFVVCGCGTPYKFSAYVGQQENWATQPGGFVKVVDNATLYPPGQLPNRPYTVIGNVATDNEQNLAKAVHEQHADAALIYNDQTYNNGSVTVVGEPGYRGGLGFGWAIPLTHRDVNARLIKFK